jgi:hypothetical protein
VGLASCDEKLSDLTAPTPNLKPTFASIQNEILSQKCIGCHNGTGTRLPGVMNLKEGSAYASLVGVASLEQGSLLRVSPGDPDNSYIYRKLAGENITGQRMPLNGTALTKGQLDVIERWIEIGAPNN